MLKRYENLGFKAAGKNLYLVVQNQQVLGQVQIGTAYEHLFTTSPIMYNKLAMIATASEGMLRECEKLLCGLGKDLPEVRELATSMGAFFQLVKGDCLLTMRAAEVGRDQAENEQF